MGQIQNKCSCLFKNEEKNTYQFESTGEGFNNSKGFNGNVNLQQSHSQISMFEDKASINQNFLKSKAQVNDPNQSYNKAATSSTVWEDKKKLSYTGGDTLSYDNENKSTIDKGLVTTVDVKNLPQVGKYVRMIQRMWKGHLIRKRFNKIKAELLEQEDLIISEYERCFNTDGILKYENESLAPFNKDGWKKFYSENDEFFNFNYGKVFYKRILVYGEEAFYSGQLDIDNKKHGYGVLIEREGVKREGFWRFDSFTGWGRLIDSDGVLYEGRFLDGVLDGKGERISSKSHYLGDFKNGLREGFGTEETVDHTYVGGYLNDKKNGKGKLEYKKMKDIYDGEFKDNCITGFGFYTWSNNDTFLGTFLNGKMHGSGTYKWPDGGEYIGEYVDNIKEGKGRFKWSNGKIFEGPFRNGKPDGKGLLFSGTSISEVEFVEGKLLKNSKKELTSN